MVKNSRITDIVAREAARLRYDEPESYREYLHAKKEAAKRNGTTILPDNKTIYIMYQEIADFYEGKEHRIDLAKRMREEALYWMEMLKEFKPRVIGSVERGDVTSKSDIDLHVFVEEEPKDVLRTLMINKIPYEYMIDTAKKKGQKKEFFHVYVEKDFNCEINVYIEDEYEPQTCSIFGTKIKGLNINSLKKKMEEQK